MIMDGKMQNRSSKKRTPTLFEAIGLLVAMGVIFGVGTHFNINAVLCMLFITILAGILAACCGFNWKEMMEVVGEKLKKVMPITSLLLVVGILLASLMYSGTLPMLIYYGIKVVKPEWLALSAFLLCLVFSITTGTSNGSVSTAGLAMIGLATAMGESVNIGLVAGAIYAGAMFGDKLSPLSDTTIMSSMITDNDIFDHIRHMSKTVIPAAIASVVIYIVIALRSQGSSVSSESTMEMLNTLDAMYRWNVILLVPLVMVLVGAVMKKPSNLVLLSASAVALLLGVFYQGFSLTQGINCLYDGFKPSIVAAARTGFDVETMSSAAKTLTSRGGISSMTKPFIMVFICLHFSAIAEACGALDVILHKILGFVKGAGSLILISGITTLLLTGLAGSSSVSLLVAGSMYKKKYEEMGLSTLNLSRTLEDFGTGTAGFFPWASSGILYATVLGVSNLTFLKYSFFSWIVVILAVFYGYTGICIKKLEQNKISEVE